MKFRDVVLDMHQGINTVADKVEYQNSGIPIIQSKNFTKGLLDLDDVRYLGINDEIKYKDKYIPSCGDVLFANIGTIGKSYVIKENKDFLIAWNVFLIKPNCEKAISDFIKYYFDYLVSTQYFDNLLTGGTVKFINKNKIGDVPFPNIDVEQQKIICKKLSKIETIIIKRQQELDKLDELVKARFVEMFGDVTTNEKKWNSSKLSELCSLKSGGTPTRQHPEYFEGNIPWITTVSLGKFELTSDDATEFITEEAIYNSATKIIPANSLLFGIRVGVGKVSKNLVPMCTNQDIMAITQINENNINLLFLKSILDAFSSFFNSQKRGATIQGIKSETLKNIDIVIPPIGLQNKFADFVKQIDKSKVAVKKALDEAQLLFDSLMQEYFG